MNKEMKERKKECRCREIRATASKKKFVIFFVNAVCQMGRAQVERECGFEPVLFEPWAPMMIKVDDVFDDNLFVMYLLC